MNTHRSIRLPDYDYASPGAYFVTTCAWQRKLLFEQPELKGIIVREWQDLPRRFPDISLDAFVVMPNHIHLIIWLGSGDPRVGAGLAPVPTLDAGSPVSASRSRGNEAGASPAPTSLGRVIGAFKSRVAIQWLHWIAANDPTASGRVWQRNYYERIIRDEAELGLIHEYIANNPARWHLDHENPARASGIAYARDWSWLEKPEAR